jgi:hypothetical protein
LQTQCGAEFAVYAKCVGDPWNEDKLDGCRAEEEVLFRDCIVGRLFAQLKEKSPDDEYDTLNERLHRRYGRWFSGRVQLPESEEEVPESEEEVPESEEEVPESEEVPAEK